MDSPKSNKYDVFIAHASEDKDNFVRPLAIDLRGRGLGVWYDEFTLKLGDSLRKSIDYGLANSRYGIVVLSHNFFKKNWPEKELNGLFAREVKGKKIIIPLWHGIGKDEVCKYSPMLADRIAIRTSEGIDYIINKILAEINIHRDRKIGLDLYHGEIFEGFEKFLSQNGFKPVLINHPIDKNIANPINILLILTLGYTSQKTFDNIEIETIYNFIYKGGALICADQAWSWVYKKYGNKPVEKFPLNVLGKRLGFFITGKHIGAPSALTTDITSGIKSIERINLNPSEIEFNSPSAQAFIRDEKSRIIAGYFTLGKGCIFVIGHKSILEENPKLVLNILSHLVLQRCIKDNHR